MTRLLHTADWHLGKTFHRFSADPDIQAGLRQERFDAIDRLAAVAQRHEVDAVLVAGDCFHSNDVDDRTLLKALDAIGGFPAPVLMIPGNHDHGGAGSIWERRSFRDQRASRAPNLELIIDEPRAVEVGDKVTVCAIPVRERFHQVALRDLAELESAAGRARVGLVHAAVDSFNEDESGRPLLTAGGEQARLDVLLLGDYHRQQAVEQLPFPAWYAGTHEPDGFPSHHQAGERRGACLLVDVAGPGAVTITPLSLEDGKGWVRIVEHLHGSSDLDLLEARMRELAAGRAGSLLCACDLDGSTLSYDDHLRWQNLVTELEPAFASLAVQGRIHLEPSESELADLTTLPGIAGKTALALHERLQAGEPQARLALASLYDLNRGQVS